MNLFLTVINTPLVTISTIMYFQKLKLIEGRQHEKMYTTIYQFIINHTK